MKTILKSSATKRLAGATESAGLPGPGSGGMNRTMVIPAPPVPRHIWAVLLAGGDGIRLRDLTMRIVGDHRPKARELENELKNS